MDSLNVKFSLVDFKFKSGLFVSLIVSLFVLLSFYSFSVFAQPVDCWQYDNNETGCVANSDICSWSDPWCDEIGCWNFFNESTCDTASSSGLSCTWNNQTTGTNGFCGEPGCWDYNTQSACDNASALGCQWDSQGSFCDNFGCWEWTTQSACDNASALGCQWDLNSNFCYETGCWDYNYNYTGCTNALNGTCKYDNSSNSCFENGCWDFWNQTACNSAQAQQLGCQWENFTGGNQGWCEEIGCWKWNGNQTLCESANSTYDLNCAYDNSTGSGFCYETFTGCSDINNQFDCFDTGYCVWNNTNTSCQDPAGGGGDFVNPGCWSITPAGQNACGNVSVCDWDAGTSSCNDNTTGANGIQCANITDANLCNGIPTFSTCCSWNGTTCGNAPWSTLCWDSIEPPPEGAAFCEDYNAIDDENLCNQIAGNPWYMPCKWDNTTNQCGFNVDDYFGGGDVDYSNIRSRSDCNYIGGVWVEDSYCDNGNLVGSGHCEPDFGIGSKSCDSNCWACEFQPDGSAWSDVNDAKTACESSSLGFCVWETDSLAANGLGWCSEHSDIPYGGGDCDQNCFDCDIQQNPQSACDQSSAGCQWYPDPGNGTQGHCGTLGESQCSNDCFSCFDSDTCINIGKGGNSCEWDSNNYLCKPLNFDGEICFDGTDNDGDSFIDCADSDCITDDFCGGDTISDCFNWGDNTTCTSNGCTWINDTFGERCDFNGSQCFAFDGNQTACEADSDCKFFIPPEGDICDINESSVQPCFMANNNQTACEALNSSCTWRTDEFNSSFGWCDAKAFECFWNFTLNQNATLCNANPSCTWFTDQWGSWCESSCFSLNNSACNADPSCEVISGFCDPEFFDHGGGFGGDQYGCFEFDFNETGCDGKEECSWQTFPGEGSCEIDYSGNCFQYNQTGCTTAPANTTCDWFSDPFGGGWCGNKIEECFANITLQNNATLCNNNALCTFINESDWQACEPNCFNSTLSNNATACNAVAGCGFRSGFCESSSIAGTFQGVEGGQPVILSADNCPEGGISQESDICGIGIKDSPNSYTFGTKVVSMKDAAACNGMPVFDGGAGNGYTTTKFFWYLDTDGNSTNGCNSHNGAEVGFEFYLSYVSRWINGSLNEVKSVSRCANSSWTSSDISPTSWNEFMCNDIGGGILGIEKSEFNRFPTLYDRTKDMRVYATTADNVTNRTSPADTTGPGYYSPGTADFRIENCEAVGQDFDGDGFTAEDDPDCTDYFRYGYVPVEEGPSQCTDNIDNDNDNKIDCNDEGCWYEDFCGGSFDSSYVANLNDTTTPKIIKSNIEVFTDAAFIGYATSEPASGTLVFYYNTSSCSGTNTTVLSSQMLDSNLNNYTIWHDGPMDNFTFNPQPLSSALSLNTSYYYKITVCDPSSNCGTSACLNFTTPETAADCTNCNFNFRFDYTPPSAASATDPIGNMQFSFDWNGDGIFEETQGGVCGATAGVRINHTEALGGAGAIMFNNPNSTSNWSFDFKNITISGGLSQQLTNITDSDIIFNETESNASGTPQNVTYIGIDTSKWLDLKEETNLKSVQLNIPGNWAELWHCSYNTTSGNISSCLNVTNQTISGPSYNNTTDSTTWEVPPEIGFSIFGGENYVPGGSSSSGSPNNNNPGGGGGGGAPTECTVQWACTQWSACIDGTQTRVCTDQNNCTEGSSGTVSSLKPLEQQNCEASPPAPPAQPPSAPPAGPPTGQVISPPGGGGLEGPIPGVDSTTTLLIALVIISVIIIAVTVKRKV